MDFIKKNLYIVTELKMSNKPKKIEIIDKVNISREDKEILKRSSSNIPYKVFKTTEIKNLDKNSNNFIRDLRCEIKKLDWKSLTRDWTIIVHPNQYSEKKIKLNPYKDSSRENPLYRHKVWLKTIYHNENFDLNNKQIAELCGVADSVIGRWRRKFGIKKKHRGKGKYIVERDGRIWIRVPEEDYNHPQLAKSKNRSVTYRLEHIYMMEKFLSKNLHLKISKKCLIGGQYLDTKSEVHHINFVPTDNRIKNLWCFEDKESHAKCELTVRDVFTKLIKLGQIGFSNGKYYINRNFNYRNLDHNFIKDILEKNKNKIKNQNQLGLENMSDIQKAFKDINWNDISKDWTVSKFDNKLKVRKSVRVNPYIECSDHNPLYMHKKWLEKVYKEPRFRMSDSKIGKLCGISRDKARYWRQKVHKIDGKKEWGKNKVIDKGDGRIWIRIPKSYKNPVVDKEDYHRRLMLEHRYVMERFLAQHPHWKISKRTLIKGKYLKTECEVHHINLDYQDNRLGNLWIFETNDEHQEARKSLYNLLDKLLKLNLISFQNGEYKLNFN